MSTTTPGSLRDWKPRKLSEEELPRLTARFLTSNTKVSFFQAYATGVQPFRTVISSTRMPNAFTTLAKLDQDQTCLLQHGAEMVQALTEGIVKLDRVVQCRGYVVAANLAENVSLRFPIGLPPERDMREIGSFANAFRVPVT